MHCTLPAGLQLYEVLVSIRLAFCTNPKTRPTNPHQAWRNRDLDGFNNVQFDAVTNPNGGRTTNPNFDSREFQFDLDFNNNGVEGEIFYMRFPPLTGSREYKLADGESVQPCPE